LTKKTETKSLKKKFKKINLKKEGGQARAGLRRHLCQSSAAPRPPPQDHLAGPAEAPTQNQPGAPRKNMQSSPHGKKKFISYRPEVPSSVNADCCCGFQSLSLDPVPWSPEAASLQTGEDSRLRAGSHFDCQVPGNCS